MKKLRLSIFIIIAVLFLGNFQSALVSAQQVGTGSFPETAMPMDDDARDRFLDFLGSQDIAPYFYPFANLGLACGVAHTGLAAPGESVSAAGSDVPKDFSLGADNSMRAVNLAKQLMVDYSLTGAQAAGIVGNFMLESGGTELPPNKNEQSYGGVVGAPQFKGGYGWAQWTGPRQTAFINFAIQYGYMSSKSDSANDAANYAFLRYELEGSEKKTIPAVAGTNTPAAAATAFEAAFERAGKPNLTARIAYANKLFAAISAGTSLTETSGVTDLNQSAAIACELIAPGLSTGGVIFENVVFPLAVASKSGVKNQQIFINGSTSQAGHGYIAFDILAPAGTQVVALTGGTVESVKATGSMGGSVTVWDSSRDIHVYYTHMSPSVSDGAQISPGTPLGSLVSVKQFPAINADHLHIDAGPGKTRQSCSRGNLSGAACTNRLDIGPDLYKAFQTLPE